MGLESLTASSASAMNRLQSNVVKAFTGYYRLKDFIHALRACKTLSAERALIANESFAIRTAFKEEVGPEHRYHSVAKLLYIYLLGYPAHFGQVECLKLAASSRLKDKRLGYLGVVLLLDEQQQTLTLVTNSLKNDLNSPNSSIVALALSTMAAIGSAEIAYELVDEVVRLVSSTNPYVRKKAAFCACRLVDKVPELGEYFEEKVSSLVGDRNHSVAMGGISLAQELLKTGPSTMLQAFRRSLVPQLTRLLQSLITSGFSLDYDVGGINDPFLQVKVLRLLRTLGEADSESSERMADVLTHLATSIDGNRNVGQAVLYEALTTILRIRTDDALRTMAINILARLLTNHTDNNLRYVGLALLHRIVGDPIGNETVQQHKSTVLECLSDPDFSIRKRAVEVALTLINRATIKPIASHLMNTILDPVATTSLAKDSKSTELASLVLTKLSILAAQFAPNAKWYADTLVYLLACLHDNTMASKEEIVSLFIRIVANTEEIHRYASELLWKEVAAFGEGVLHSPKPTEALLQATAWCIGEYGELLVKGQTVSSFESLVEKVASWADLEDISNPCLCYFITALGKLSLRYEPLIPRITEHLIRIANSNYRSAEVYGKATETMAFIQNSALRTLLFAKIPADSTVSLGTLPTSINPVGTATASFPDSIQSRSGSPAPALDVFAELAMLSLDGLNSKASSSVTSSNLPSPLAAFSTNKRASLDPSNWGKEAYSANGLSLYLKLVECEGNGQQVLMTVYNRLSAPVPSFQAQAAVPRSLRIALDPATSQGIPPNNCLTQLFRISYASDEPTVVDLPKIEPAKLKLRLKIAYALPLSSQSISEVVDFSNF